MTGVWRGDSKLRWFPREKEEREEKDGEQEDVTGIGWQHPP